MSFSYDLSKLSDAALGPLMRFRLALGDTVQGEVHLQDEEINYFLSQYPDFWRACSEGAQAIANRYAHEASYSQGSLRKELGARATLWREVGASLSGKIGMSNNETSFVGVPQPLNSYSGYALPGRVAVDPNDPLIFPWPATNR